MMKNIANLSRTGSAVVLLLLSCLSILSSVLVNLISFTGTRMYDLDLVQCLCMYVLVCLSYLHSIYTGTSTVVLTIDILHIQHTLDKTFEVTYINST